MQNAESPQSPPSPVAPQAPSAQIPGVGAIPLTGDLPLPQTRQELQAIRQRREWLSDQLISATNRRNEIAERLAGIPLGDRVNRAGLENRLKVLDDRISQIELEIAATGRQLTNAPTSALTEPDIPPWERMETGQVTAISIVFTIFVLFPLAISMSRLMWRRASMPRPKRDPADDERFMRLEQAMETIAIEVERIGEGQRFMTRLLTDANGAAPLLGARREDEMVRARGEKG